MSFGKALRAWFVSNASVDRPPPWPNISSIPPVSAEDEEMSLSLGLTPCRPADSQTFILSYRDSDDCPTRRRITVVGTRKNQDGIPVLLAYCHEAKGHRNFRVDRMELVSDFDGLEFDPNVFVRANFGIVWPLVTTEVRPVHYLPFDWRPVGKRWDDIRNSCHRGGVVLLNGLALSDAEVTPSEADVIWSYALSCCASDGLELSPSERDDLSVFVRRLRPTVQGVTLAVQTLLEQPSDRIQALLQSAELVITADGQVHSRETEALRSLQASLAP